MAHMYDMDSLRALKDQKEKIIPTKLDEIILILSEIETNILSRLEGFLSETDLTEQLLLMSRISLIKSSALRMDRMFSIIIQNQLDNESEGSKSILLMLAKDIMKNS